MYFKKKAAEWTRQPTKTHTFRVLKRMGMPVGTVIDVGILSSTYELLSEFRDCHQILIEPIVEFEDRIRQTYDKEGIDYELIKVAASRDDGDTLMRVKSVRDGVDITHARMATEQETNGNMRTVPMRKVDTLVAERSLEKPYLLKIDVDGAELDILAGAEETLKECSIVCIEVGIDNIYKRSEALLGKGFQLFDIVDLCYYDDRLVQADAIFVRTSIIKELKLEIYRNGFDIDKWKPYQAG